MSIYILCITFGIFLFLCFIVFLLTNNPKARKTICLIIGSYLIISLCFRLVIAHDVTSILSDSMYPKEHFAEAVDAAGFDEAIQTLQNKLPSIEPKKYHVYSVFLIPGVSKGIVYAGIEAAQQRYETGYSHIVQVIKMELDWSVIKWQYTKLLYLPDSPMIPFPESVFWPTHPWMTLWEKGKPV